MKTCRKGLHQYDSKCGQCPKCKKIANTIWKKVNPDKVKGFNAVYRKANLNKVKAQIAAWRKANPDKEKTSRAAWRKANRDKIKGFDAAHRKTNLNKIKKTEAAYRKANPDKVRAATAAWRKANRGKYNATKAKHRAAKIRATPSWLTEEHLEKIQEFYTLAKELEWLGNEPLEVDHIVPLQGDNVSGLHVPWNLQILPSSVNSSKGNRFE